MSFTVLRRELVGMAETIKQLEVDAEAAVILMLDEAGRLTVEYLQSETSVRRPPYYPGGSFRFAHPGGWADRSGVLAESYRYVVDRNPPKLTIINDDPGGYGATLEKRAGFYVLTGVTDPGGPLETTLRRVIKTVAPEWLFGGFE